MRLEAVHTFCQNEGLRVPDDAEIRERSLNPTEEALVLQAAPEGPYQNEDLE